MTIREVSALMSVLDSKLEDHLEDHREVLAENDAKQRRRATRLQLFVSFGMLLSPVLSILTQHVLHH